MTASRKRKRQRRARASEIVRLLARKERDRQKESSSERAHNETIVIELTIPTYTERLKIND